jgi:hypothetical protein
MSSGAKTNRPSKFTSLDTSYLRLAASTDSLRTTQKSSTRLSSSRLQRERRKLNRTHVLASECCSRLRQLVDSAIAITQRRRAREEVSDVDGYAPVTDRWCVLDAAETVRSRPPPQGKGRVNGVDVAKGSRG